MKPENGDDGDGDQPKEREDRRNRPLPVRNSLMLRQWAQNLGQGELSPGEARNLQRIRHAVKLLVGCCLKDR